MCLRNECSTPYTSEILILKKRNIDLMPVCNGFPDPVGAITACSFGIALITLSHGNKERNEVPVPIGKRTNRLLPSKVGRGNVRCDIVGRGVVLCIQIIVLETA
jgi:hypothetical protein